MRLVCSLVLLLGGLQLTCALLVAAWNIQIFGPKKTSNAQIMDYIADFIKVVRQYDVIVIQEVRGELTVVNKLMGHLNPTPANGPVYDYIVSGKLGLGNHKERYLYVYKTTTVTHVPGDTYQYPDNNDDFVRPPFAAKFTVSGQPSFDFVMIPLHAKPGSGKTVLEINALDDVVKEVKATWTIKNILLLGDFNAGGKFLPKKDKKKITLTAPDYHWLIGDDAGTNLANTQAYDRIVATNDMFNDHVKAGAGAMAYDFSQALPTGVLVAKDVSDHFPVEVELL